MRYMNSSVTIRPRRLPDEQENAALEEASRPGISPSVTGEFLDDGTGDKQIPGDDENGV